MNKSIKTGYSIFGKPWQVMFENDLHHIQSIDHELLRTMVLIDGNSNKFLYQSEPKSIDMTRHELHQFSQQFRLNNDYETIKNVIKFTNQIASQFDMDFKDMIFGGTEVDILARGTDWCSDMARVASVILMCLNIPCRMVHLVNENKAYHGHVVVEVYYEKHYGVVDPIHNYVFYHNRPLSTLDLLNNKVYMKDMNVECVDYYKLAAISFYNPLEKHNLYFESRANEYYLNLISNNHQGKWIMSENDL